MADYDLQVRVRNIGFPSPDPFTEMAIADNPALRFQQRLQAAALTRGYPVDIAVIAKLRFKLRIPN